MQWATETKGMWMRKLDNMSSVSKFVIEMCSPISRLVCARTKDKQCLTTQNNCDCYWRGLLMNQFTQVEVYMLSIQSNTSLMQFYHWSIIFILVLHVSVCLCACVCEISRMRRIAAHLSPVSRASPGKLHRLLDEFFTQMQNGQCVVCFLFGFKQLPKPYM